MEDELKEKTNIESNNKNNIKSEKKKNNIEKPDDQDLIDEIVKIDNSNLKAKLLCLNELNTNLIDTKQINYKPEYVGLRNKYELKYFDVYQKIIDIAVGNKSPDELISFTKEELEKYNINEESDDKKPIEKFFVKAIRNSNFFPFNKKDGNVLDYLINIKFIPLENKVDFRVEYYFNKNPYMENELLTKTYYFNLKNERLIKSDYCEIKWTDKDSDPTKKLKIKKKSGKKTQATFQDTDSFFNMFYANKTNLLIDDTEARFLKEDFLPNLMEYYLNFPQFNKKEESKKNKK
jgi:hypothetical protein